MSDGYQGWTNYETWAVALWLDNEEPSYRYWNNQAQDILDGVETRDEARIQLARQLETEMDEAVPDLGASVWADLLSAAFSEVEWFEIADHYLSDKEKETADETEVGAV